MNETTYYQHPIKTEINITDLVTIHYFEYGKEYLYSGESHDFWEIMYADRGSVIVTCEEKEHLLSCGELILLPPGHFHTLRTHESSPSNVFIISFTEDSTVLNPLSDKIIPLNDSMKKLIHTIITESTKTFILPMTKINRRRLHVRSDMLFGGEQIIKMRLEELLIFLYRNQITSQEIFVTKARYDDVIAEQILELLKENIYADITLSDITFSMGYGKTYLSNIFKKVYGQSIINYYMHLKIDTAKHLLRKETLTISQIADMLCFSSPQYFSKRFTQMVNMSPKQYANSVRADWTTIPEVC